MTPHEALCRYCRLLRRLHEMATACARRAAGPEGDALREEAAELFVFMTEREERLAARHGDRLWWRRIEASRLIPDDLKEAWRALEMMR